MTWLFLSGVNTCQKREEEKQTEREKYQQCSEHHLDFFFFKVDIAVSAFLLLARLFSSRQILCPMFVYVLFYVNLCHD